MAETQKNDWIEAMRAYINRDDPDRPPVIFMRFGNLDWLLGSDFGEWEREITGSVEGWGWR